MIGPILLIAFFICIASIFIPALRQVAKAILATGAVLAVGIGALMMISSH